VLVKSGRLDNLGTYNNEGYTLANVFLVNTNFFNNSGVLKYKSLSGNAIIESSNSSVIVKNAPIPIFDYSDVNNNYSGSIAIFTDEAATISAGTFTAPNTFVPDATLPSYSQTLYAKITTSGAVCSYIVPFQYNNISNANLSALTSSAGTLNPVFNTEQQSYTIFLDNLTTSTTLTPTTSVFGSSVTVNGTTVNSGNASPMINLNSGLNTITIVVTAIDNITTKTYIVVIARADNLISITPNLSYICPSEPVQLTASGCAGTVSWQDNDGQQTTGTSSTFTPATTTTYFASCSTGGTAATSIQVAVINVAVNADILTESLSVKAIQRITSNRKVGQQGITPTTNVSFEAGNSIKLSPGFETINSSVFKAEIKQCPN
jgi:hypothetical protein